MTRNNYKTEIVIKECIEDYIMDMLTNKDGELTETGETYRQMISEAIEPIIKEMVEKDFSFAEIQYVIENTCFLEIYKKR